MRMERDCLWRDAVPRLRQFCTQHSLTFQLIDLPWDLHHLHHHSLSSSSAAAAGTEAEWITSLRSSELARCQAQSIGPDFVVSVIPFTIHLYFLLIHQHKLTDASSVLAERLVGKNISRVTCFMTVSSAMWNLNSVTQSHFHTALWWRRYCPHFDLVNCILWLLYIRINESWYLVLTWKHISSLDIFISIFSFCFFCSFYYDVAQDWPWSPEIKTPRRFLPALWPLCCLTETNSVEVLKGKAWYFHIISHLPVFR